MNSENSMSYVPAPEFGYVREVFPDKGYGYLTNSKKETIVFHFEDRSVPVKKSGRITFGNRSSGETHSPKEGMEVTFIAGMRENDRHPQAECWMSRQLWNNACDGKLGALPVIDPESDIVQAASQTEKQRPGKPSRVDQFNAKHRRRQQGNGTLIKFPGSKAGDTNLGMAMEAGNTESDVAVAG